MSTIPPTEDRFAFGENWLRFLQTVDEPRIEAAMQGLRQMLGVERLDGQTFLDIGCGSGLSSLAAARLGATVVSFDYDESSVACSRELKCRFAADAANWTIGKGSAIDVDYMQSLGKFDIVYSWGVLHHTGDQAKALELAAQCVADGGVFVHRVVSRSRFCKPSLVAGQTDLPNVAPEFEAVVGAVDRRMV